MSYESDQLWPPGHPMHPTEHSILQRMYIESVASWNLKILGRWWWSDEADAKIEILKEVKDWIP